MLCTKFEHIEILMNEVFQSDPSTYHVLHVGGWGVNLTPQLVVQVQDEVHVPLTDSPPPPWPGPPPRLVLVPVLVQYGFQLCGIGEDHGQGSLGQTEKQARSSDPAREKRTPLHGKHVIVTK